MDVVHAKRLYFIGIGGIGMSALARYFRKMGAEVYGYDRTKTALTEQLEDEGMHIHYEERPDLIPEDVDYFIYTPAIPESHAEMRLLRQKNQRIYKRAEMLGLLSQAQRSIAVAGTHGKTTTSTMLTWILRDAGLDNTAFLGGIAVNFESNFVHGKGAWLVLEADEYDRSFLHLDPEIAILTSTDADHLDIYGNPEQMQEGFKKFLQKITRGGLLVIQQDVKNQLSADLINALTNKIQIVSYGIEKGDYAVSNISFEHGASKFEICMAQDTVQELLLPMAGVHNLENACAAIVVAMKLGVSHEQIRNALARFKGIRRRFEKRFEDDRKVLVDDYAHHPTEIRAAVQAMRKMYPGRHLTVAFQPHLFSRTRDFLDGFAKELAAADRCILLEIYPAREEPIAGITSTVLFEKIKTKEKYLTSKGELPGLIKSLDTEAILVLGAGDIDTTLSGIIEVLNTSK